MMPARRPQMRNVVFAASLVLAFATQALVVGTVFTTI